MKLFTKEIDNKLFSQYSMGADLEKQKVVAKIFNPYGRGRWYLLNSDPEDRDYLWAIVEMDGEVEIGSVSRSQLENIKIGPYKFPLERDIYFTPVNAAKLYRDLIIKAEDELTGESEGERRAGMDEFKHGGQIDIAQQNKDMLLNYAEELEHHTEEFEEAAKKAENVEPWVVAKIERSTTENEITREYGNGEGEEMAKGGRVMEKGDAVIYDDQTYFITEKNGRVGLVSMRQSAAGSRPPIIDISKIDVDKEVTDMYGDKVIIPSKFERGGKINIGTNTKTDSDVYYDRNTKSFYIYVIDGAGSRVNKLEVDSIDDVLKKFPNWKWSEAGRKEFKSEKGKMASGGGVGEPYDSMTKYQLEKEYKKLNEKRDLLKKKFGNFDSKEISENEKEIEKILTLLYGENFSGVGQKYKYASGGMMAEGGLVKEIKEFEKYNYPKPKTKGDKVRAIFSHFEKKGYTKEQINSALGEMKYASGGEVKFADKVKSIKSSLLKRKKVSPSVQKDYGKTYSPKEAEESAKRIVGATTAKERLMNRMKKGKK